jgi:hypothetical protein
MKVTSIPKGSCAVIVVKGNDPEVLGLSSGGVGTLASVLPFEGFEESPLDNTVITNGFFAPRGVDDRDDDVDSETASPRNCTVRMCPLREEWDGDRSRSVSIPSMRSI